MKKILYKKQNEKHDNVDDELELIVRIRSSCGFEKVKMILQFVLCRCVFTTAVELSSVMASKTHVFWFSSALDGMKCGPFSPPSHRSYMLSCHGV